MVLERQVNLLVGFLIFAVQTDLLEVVTLQALLCGGSKIGIKLQYLPEQLGTFRLHVGEFLSQILGFTRFKLF